MEDDERGPMEADQALLDHDDWIFGSLSTTPTVDAYRRHRLPVTTRSNRLEFGQNGRCGPGRAFNDDIRSIEWSYDGAAGANVSLGRVAGWTTTATTTVDDSGRPTRICYR